MDRVDFIPIRWESIGETRADDAPAPRKTDDSSAFELLMEKALETHRPGEIDATGSAERLLIQSWASSVMSTVQRHLLASFTGADDASAASAPDLSAMLSLAARLRDARSSIVPTPESAGPDAEKFPEIIREASRLNRLPERLIRAVIKAESNFNPKAASPVGARGLMQLMPQTARDLGVEDSLDPRQNVLGGARYLRLMLDRYDGNLRSALAAYNWGPANVDAKGTGNLPDETRGYLRRIAELLKADGNI